jgi:hypothetical protein
MILFSDVAEVLPPLPEAVSAHCHDTETLSTRMCVNRLSVL